MLFEFKNRALAYCLFAIAALAGLPDPVASEQFGPHELTVLYTPMLQHSVRTSDTNVNAELDVIGRFRLSPGNGGIWGETHLSFWALGNHTIGGSLPTGQFSRNAGLLWDSNDGDAPDPDWVLGVFALQQEYQASGFSGTIEVGKVYPGLNLASLPYAGDDRDSFMSQIIASDMAGRWFDRIGLGASISAETDHVFGRVLFSDATAQGRLLDFDSLSDGSDLVAVELGVTPLVAGRTTKISLLPYLIYASNFFTREKGLVLTFSHDLAKASSGNLAPISLFGRYTFRDGGEPLNAEARAEAKPLKHGGFIGVAFYEPFGWQDQQIAFAAMYGSASATARSNGLSSQSGLEAYWKFGLSDHAVFTTGLQVIDRGSAGVEYIPGLRLQLSF